MIKLRGMVYTHIIRVLNMKVNGLMIYSAEKGLKLGKMALDMMENIYPVRKMDRVSMHGLIIAIMMENGSKI